ncbi:MAG: hypothetical protein M3N26_06980 [Pseudomonadota bacterium]|nr:hypothetical protein [Pseudomonadota bacterium]
MIWFSAVQVWAGHALDALVALHIAGALKHGWTDREALLTRMRVGPAAD